MVGLKNHNYKPILIVSVTFFVVRFDILPILLYFIVADKDSDISGEG